MEKIKCYVLDFGDTNLISQDINDITSWIANDIAELNEGDELDYNITIKMMTAYEISQIPEWS